MACNFIGIIKIFIQGERTFERGSSKIKIRIWGLRRTRFQRGGGWFRRHYDVLGNLGEIFQRNYIDQCLAEPWNRESIETKCKICDENDHPTIPSTTANDLMKKVIARKKYIMRNKTKQKLTRLPLKTKTTTFWLASLSLLWCSSTWDSHWKVSINSGTSATSKLPLPSRKLQ